MDFNINTKITSSSLNVINVTRHKTPGSYIEYSAPQLRPCCCLLVLCLCSIQHQTKQAVPNTVLLNWCCTRQYHIVSELQTPSPLLHCFRPEAPASVTFILTVSAGSGVPVLPRWRLATHWEAAGWWPQQPLSLTHTGVCRLYYARWLRVSVTCLQVLLELLQVGGVVQFNEGRLLELAEKAKLWVSDRKWF